MTALVNPFGYVAEACPLGATPPRRRGWGVDGSGATIARYDSRWTSAIQPAGRGYLGVPVPEAMLEPATFCSAFLEGFTSHPYIQRANETANGLVGLNGVDRSDLALVQVIVSAVKRLFQEEEMIHESHRVDRAFLDARSQECIELCLVVPVYNEEKSVAQFVNRVRKIFDHTRTVTLDVVFVNDGSTDDTLARLLDLQEENPGIRIVDLSRNFGKEAALTAGLKVASGQVVVPIDVDLQDPPELIPEMISKWREGYDVVLGKRQNRDSDSWAKRQSATWFYRIRNRMTEPKIPEHVGDFRLLDRSVVDALNDLPESRRFMKGLFAWVGFRTASVEYARPARVSGTTKFNGWKLWNFALEGIMSFSTGPLRVWTYLGVVIALTSLAFGIRIVVKVLFQGVDVPGYASVFVAVTCLGGLQLIGIGIIGEYLGRAYIESKRRPVYLIRRIYTSNA